MTNEFVILLGYKGSYIREFLDYRYKGSVLSIDLKNNEVHAKNSDKEDWKIELVDTGLNTMTGGRISQIQEIVGDDDFFLTYGDGLSDVDLSKAYDSHKVKNSDNDSSKTIRSIWATIVR